MVLKITAIFGVRPEAIKMAPVIKAFREHPDRFSLKVLVTAQHREMLDQVLEHFRIVPDWDLDIMTPRQTLTQTTTRALEGIERVLVAHRPDLVLVHGDVATTVAGALAAYYQKIPVGHVEAGLRTGDKYAPFPEEMCRRLTDALSDLHFAPTTWARDNLLREGIDPKGIFVTGNTAIDALLLTVDSGYRFSTVGHVLDRERRLIVVDVHRRENFGPGIRNVCEAVAEAASRRPDIYFIFSVHRNPEVEEIARTVLSSVPRVHLFEPLPYPEWANLLSRAYLILTDSGGLQEEAPSLGTPVLLCRETTERPEAIQAGTVRMVGTDKQRILATLNLLLDSPEEYDRMSRASNPYGDGNASWRIVKAVANRFGLGLESER
ncbi:MAG: UDP-N-acetylglucosamine 2-epimerase (non-hydrolyzing) [Bacillota bacterium]